MSTTAAPQDRRASAEATHSETDRSQKGDDNASVTASETSTAGEFTPAGVSRVAAFYTIFDTRPKVAIFASAFILWMIGYALSWSTTYVYLAFATSDFSSHTIIGTIAVVTAIMSSIIPPFWAKLADFVSRPVALGAACLLYVVGYAVTAGSHTVSTVSAGQVIYTMGNSGMSFLQTLLLADATSLQNRGTANGLVSLPYIPFAFVSGLITDAISLTSWRAGFGMFIAIMPVCVGPIVACLVWSDRQARKQGVLSVAASSLTYQLGITGQKSDRSLGQQIFHALSVIDAVGLVLVGFTFAMLLAPTTLTTTATGGWKNPSLIAMQTVGGVLFIILCLWEWKFAKHPIMPMRILNRTFIMCCIIDFMYYLVAYLTDVYWASWVYVVTDYNDRDYTYMNQIETVTLCLFAFFGGLIQRYTHRYKWLQVTGLGIRCLGSGINYYSSLGHTNTATLFFAKFLLCVGGGISVIGSQVGAQGSVKHKDVALAISILSLWTNVGGAIGSAISATIWNANLVKNLNIYAGTALTQDEIASIFGSIEVARTAEPRAEIIKAYNATYRLLSLPALVAIFLPFIAGFFVKDFYLDNRQNAVEATIVGPQLKSQSAPAATLAAAEHDKEEEQAAKDNEKA